MQEVPEKKLTTEGCPFTHTIDVQDLDERFPINTIIRGPRSINMKKIQDDTGAIVILKGGGSEKITIDVGAQNQEQLNAGIDATDSLVNEAYEAFDKWLAEGCPHMPEMDRTGGHRRGGGRKRMRGGRGRNGSSPVEPTVSGTPPVPESREPFYDFVELNLPTHEPRFAPRGKLLGRGGIRINEIQRKTRSRIELSGTDSNLKLECFAMTEGDLYDAMADLRNLVDNVHQEYENFMQMNGSVEPINRPYGGITGPAVGQYGGPKGGGKGGKGAKGGPGELRKILKLKEVENTTELKSKLRGIKCENIHHIQDETGAQVWVLGGEGTEPVRVEVSCYDQAKFDAALDLVKSLIKAVFKDFDCGDGGDAKRARLS